MNIRLLCLGLAAPGVYSGAGAALPAHSGQSHPGRRRHTTCDPHHTGSNFRFTTR